ncbi:RIP metalloprotease RseP [Lacisediminimonas profundi]|uniref:RIP metalloprotease RseP n=1 Tax=Lacisediminimonas profundi TaxID=2603856 RepID=UPI00124B81AF|nr:RIP metalloprotease RseP [Lacisediminimonas profundi]
MMLIQTVLAFLVVLGTLVVVHELGHYLAARWCGVKVLRFSVGMGRIVWSRRFGRDQTEWALSALPLGGYVKMLDAREQDLSKIAPADLAREFTRQSVWRRIIIVAAGPLANFLLAILVFAGLYMYGIPEPTARLRAAPAHSAAAQAGVQAGDLVTRVNGQAVDSWSTLRWKMIDLAVDREVARIEVMRADPQRPGASRTEELRLRTDMLSVADLEGDFLGKLGLDLARPAAVLGRIGADGPAERAGLRSGDAITAIDGRPVADAVAFVESVRAAPGRALTLTGLRQGQPFTLSVTPAPVSKDGKTFGRIQAEVPMAPEMAVSSSGPIKALGQAVVKTWDTSTLTLRMLGKMLVGEVSWKNITGPITIADYAGQTARIGIISFLSYIAFISISLGVMNLLPIPVLDGGLLLYYSVEVLTGRPVSERFGELAQRAGIGILMTLMMVAMFNDIVRLIS